MAQYIQQKVQYAALDQTIHSALLWSEPYLSAKGILTALIIRDINGLHFGHSHIPTKKALRYETIYD